jgi:circadian clock protein KaiC
VYTSLTGGGSMLEQSEVGISSLMDTWLLLRVVESSNERNRLLYILKSRGMAHSNQMREFQLTDDGIRLLDVYVGPGQVLTGSARLVQEAKDQAKAALDMQASDRKQRELERERIRVRGEAEAIAKRLADIGEEIKMVKKSDAVRRQFLTRERRDLSLARKAD